MIGSDEEKASIDRIKSGLISKPKVSEMIINSTTSPNHTLISENNFIRCLSDKTKLNVQKQPSRGVFKKRCSGNMQQIYRRTSMLKCDFNKVAKQWVFSCKFAAYFQNTFS